jgi:hypothetical protein
MLELTKNWRQLAREAIHEKDPEKLSSLANELQEALERKQAKPARRADAKSFIKTAKRPTTNIQAASERESNVSVTRVYMQWWSMCERSSSRLDGV